jgi:hypothetical protein
MQVAQVAASMDKGRDMDPRFFRATREKTEAISADLKQSLGRKAIRETEP